MGKSRKLLRLFGSKEKVGPKRRERRPLPEAPSSNAVASTGGKGKKKTGARLWMRMNRAGQWEIIEYDRSEIMRRVSIPARDLRILGPVFSHSSNILARDKAVVVNLEFIKAIVTAEEVLVLDPLSHEVLPFVDQLRQQFLVKSTHQNHPVGLEENETPFSGGEQWPCTPEAAESLHSELPFEFQVLETALEVVCTYLDSNVSDLEKEAYPVLDELARKVSTKNLERVRSLKSNLTRLLARVQKVRDELEHLLDDNDDMAYLYLTRRNGQTQQIESSTLTNKASNLAITSHLPHDISNSQYNGSFIASSHSDNDDVEDLEMLLEAYFMQLDGTRNKILSVREYIDDTEDYVNIQLDNQRNELIQFHLILTMTSLAVTMESYIVGSVSINIPCVLYNVQGLFVPFVAGSCSACVREYIDDTEDYVNIQLDNRRNELIQLQLVLTIASFAINIETLISGLFGMNIHCTLYDIDGIFGPFVGGTSAACVLLFLLILGYGRWKRLIGV